MRFNKCSSCKLQTLYTPNQVKAIAVNRLTLAKLKKIAIDKGYEVRFDRGCYKVFKKVADFDSLCDAEEFLSKNSTPPPKPLKPPQYDLTVIWKSFLANIPKTHIRELIGRMCFLDNYDGESAIIRCKPTWYDRLKTELPTISEAFCTISGKTIAVSLETIPQPPPKIPRPPKTFELPILNSGKYKIRILDEIINQGYPGLDGKKYLDVLKTVETAKILDSYQLSVGIKLSLAIPFNSCESWLFNFEVVSLAIQSSIKNGIRLLVVLQPIPRLTSSDHYLSIHTYEA